MKPGAITSPSWVIVILVAVAALPRLIAAADLSPNPELAVVAKIIDGDSLLVSREGKVLEVRLWGIDSPEYGQPGSRQSKRKLTELALGNTVSMISKYRDKYGRHVAVLSTSGLSVNEEMVATGNSWVHDYFCRETICRKWRILEERARNEKRGLWQNDNPIPPWQWKSKR